VVGRLGHLDGAANGRAGFALSDQLLSGLEFADGLLVCVANAFHGEAPGPVWPDEASHSHWTDFQGPHQSLKSWPPIDRKKSLKKLVTLHHRMELQIIWQILRGAILIKVDFSAGHEKDQLH
jgi:hypothetical protein